MADRAPITFTLDLENNWYADGDVRHRANAARLLKMLAANGIRGTVFTLGSLATTDAPLIRDFADQGHEIALHGYRHVPLRDLSASELRDDLRRGRDQLEAITGTPVRGFRAPYFSLTAATPWAPDVIAAEGFTYSSSVLPAPNPQYGWPECPARPFRWPCGLVELPVPVVRVRRVGLPFLGGLYLRLLPLPLVRLAANRVPAQLLWSYVHPYDIDAGEPYQPIAALGTIQSRMLWLRRAPMLHKLERLLDGRAGLPLEQRVAAGLDLVAGPRSA